MLPTFYVVTTMLGAAEQGPQLSNPAEPRPNVEQSGAGWAPAEPIAPNTPSASPPANANPKNLRNMACSINGAVGCK